MSSASGGTPSTASVNGDAPSPSNKDSSSRPIVLHPVLFAVAPVLSLFAHNRGEVGPRELVVPLLLIGSVTALFYWTLKSLTLDRHKAGLLVSLFVLLFLSYGHLFNVIDGLARFGITLGRDLYLLWACALVLLLGTAAILQVKRDLRKWTLFLNVFACAMTAIPGFFSLSALGSPPPVSIEEARIPPSAPLRTPDIYYIILDGYARTDVLKEIYDADNTAFISKLEDMGFFVASKSVTNYCQTRLSLASTLNLTYLRDLADRVGRNSKDSEPLRRMISYSKVAKFLRGQGYRFVVFASGTDVTKVDDADLYLKPPKNLGEFHTVLYNLTPIPAFMSYLNSGPAIEYAWHRERIEYILDTLPAIADDPAPTFTFAHILAPHPPFVFKADGTPTHPDRPFTLTDGNALYNEGAVWWEYLNGYRDQLLHVSERVTETIRQIIARSSEPPIIILQSDHGPGSMLDWGSLEKTNLKERMSILNAYHLPGIGPDLLYDTITPVNSFRLIFDAYFGTDYGLLEDSSYFSIYERPYRFIDVTDRVIQAEKKGLVRSETP